MQEQNTQWEKNAEHYFYYFSRSPVFISVPFFLMKSKVTYCTNLKKPRQNINHACVVFASNYVMIDAEAAKRVKNKEKKRTDSFLLCLV